MKKKLLPLAMLAGLAGAAGTAQAVHINPDGLGETLIYPFYSVNGDNDTYITVVNTTDQVKAVKVRILEALNSQEVLDFNLYLSPQDHWAAAITRDELGNGMIVTADQSCTVPSLLIAQELAVEAGQANGVKFRNFEYTGDGGGDGLERTIEGYVEVIEMGVIDDTAPDEFGAEDWAIHGNDGVPANCDSLVAAWLEEDVAGTGTAAGITGTGEWATEDQFGDPLPGNPDANMLPPSGGLYGYGVLINTMEGTNATYSAVALDAFFQLVGGSEHTAPGSTLPSLAGAFNAADIIDGNSVLTLGFVNNIDAVSAVFMHDTLSNDYVMEPTIEAGTDWVVNFPTKRFYVNADPFVPGPFTTEWDGEAQACEEVNMSFWSREEQVTPPSQQTGGIDFSPMPDIDAPDVEGFALCSEVNVISFFGPDADTETLEGYISAVYPSERIQYGFQPIFDNGWARLDLTTNSFGVAVPNREIVGTDGVDNYTLAGLPAIGFAVQKYTNNNVESFFSGLIEHKYTRDIEVVIP